MTKTEDQRKHYEQSGCLGEPRGWREGGMEGRGGGHGGERMESSGRKLYPACHWKPSAPTKAQRHSEDVAETFLSVESGQTPNPSSPANP